MTPLRQEATRDTAQEERWLTPNDTQHMLEIGRTGSGKSQAGLFHLSRRNFDKKAWIIVDSKGDELIEKIGRLEGVKFLKISDPIPSKPGVYIVRPLPSQYEEMEDFFWRVHAKGNVGVYIDEGFNFAKSDALDANLTQGRSKHIPIIMLSQRPSWISRYAFSESSFFQVFNLTDRRDRKTVQEFIPPEKADLEKPLPDYHSLWYDVKSNRAVIFSPVPPSEEIVATFRARLSPKRIAI